MILNAFIRPKRSAGPERRTSGSIMEIGAFLENKKPLFRRDEQPATIEDALNDLRFIQGCIPRNGCSRDTAYARLRAEQRAEVERLLALIREQHSGPSLSP